MTEKWGKFFALLCWNASIVSFACLNAVQTDPRSKGSGSDLLFLWAQRQVVTNHIFPNPKERPDGCSFCHICRAVSNAGNLTADKALCFSQPPLPRPSSIDALGRFIVRSRPTQDPILRTQNPGPRAHPPFDTSLVLPNSREAEQPAGHRDDTEQRIFSSCFSFSSFFVSLPSVPASIHSTLEERECEEKGTPLFPNRVCSQTECGQNVGVRSRP